MKTNILKLIVLVCIVAISACTKPPVDPPNDRDCRYKGKFETAVCGWGLYGSYWIRLEDGTLLQPCESDINIDASLIYEGREVEVDYYAVKPNTVDCNSLLNCLAWPGEHTNVHITCMKLLGENPKEEPSGDCKEEGILHDWTGKLDGCGWMVELNNGKMLELNAGAIDETKFSDGTPVLIGYTVANRASNCMAGTPVDLTCIRVANTTQN